MLRLLLTGAVALTALAACDRAAGDTPAIVEARQGPMLKRFGSARAFEAYVEELRRKSEQRLSEFQNEPAAMAVEEAAPAAGAPMSEVAAQPTNPEITNNQTVGVDEGGIVKQVGRYLVVLQDGRLFSADLGDVDWPVLHTISVCPLREAMDCRTTAFIGPPMREF